MKPSAYPWYAWIGEAMLSAAGGIAVIAWAMAHVPGGTAEAIILAMFGVAMIAIGICLAVVGLIRMVKWALQD